MADLSLFKMVRANLDQPAQVMQAKVIDAVRRFAGNLNRQQGAAR